jgi:CheY-like chemotaxis protein
LLVVEQRATTAGVTLTVESPDTPLEALTDGRWVQQMLVNLLSNAIEYTAPGGRVTLHAQETTDQTFLELSVSDTGIGIAPEHLRRIFDPFVQLDAGLARSKVGTGLGLTIVARMADALGGGVHVASELGAGSTFTIRIPHRRAGRVSGERSTIPSHVVLLAEDHAGNARTFMQYLTAKGLEVVLAMDGVEAVAKARSMRPPPAAILMDVQMPRMDGLQATREIRTNPQLTAVPIIALTALAMPGDREQCLAAGMNDYLAKPVALSFLYMTLLRHIERGGSPDSESLS